MLLTHQVITLSNPIRLVGVMSFPCSSDLPNYSNPHQNFNCISKSYVQWVGQTGAQPLLTPYDLDKKVLKYQLDKMQGFLISGGDGVIFDQQDRPSTYMETVSFIVRYAKKRNRRGSKFVLWGTSQGYETMLHALSRSSGSGLSKEKKNDLQKNQKSTKTSKHVTQETVDLEKSSFWGNFNQTRLKKVLNEKYLTLPKDLLSHAVLKKVTKKIKLTNTQDKKDYKTTALLEHKSFPFFGVQFHPEKTQFEKQGVNADEDTIRMMREMAFQYVEQMDKGIEGEKIEGRVRPFMAQFHTAKNFGREHPNRIYVFQNRKFNYCPTGPEERSRKEVM